MSGRNKYRERSNLTKELDVNITHNSAYGQVKKSKQAQDGSVVYEIIEDTSLYVIQANEAYGLLQHNTPCYENPNEVN